MAKEANPKKMPRILLPLTPQQVEALNALSARTRIPRAVLIREGIDDLLKKHKRK